MTVAASAERIVVAKMHGRRLSVAGMIRHAGLYGRQRRTQRGDRLVYAVRREHLTHDRREHDEPHGDEAKPGCQTVARTWSHVDEQGNAGDSSTARNIFLRDARHISGLKAEIRSFPAVTAGPDRLICVVHVGLLATRAIPHVDVALAT